MAWVRKLPSGRWKGYYRDKSGKVHSVPEKGTFLRRGDAKDRADEEEQRVRRGRWTDPRLARAPLAEYAEKWIETKGKVRPRTRINIQGRLDNHILPAFGAMAVGDLEAVDVRGWLAQLSQRLAPSTAAATYRTLSQIMKTAEIDGLISRSPCIGIELPPDSHHEEMQFLSVEQVGLLADTIDDRYRAPVLGAAYTGLRAGELWALKLPRLNLLKRSLEVTESLSEIRGELVTGPTKTGARRTVSLPVTLADTIGEHIGRYPSKDGYLFTAGEGGPVRHHNFMKRHFRPAVSRAELPQGLRFHDLRHSCAAILISEGWDLKQIQERLGHKSIRTTIDRYSHLFEGHDTELLGKLDARIRDAR